MDKLDLSPAMHGSAPAVPTQRQPRWFLPAAAAVLAVAAASAGVLIGRHGASPSTVAATAEPVSAPASAAMAAATVAAAPTATMPATGATGHTPTRSPASRHAPVATAAPGQDRPAPVADKLPTRQVAVCARCGVVESVRSEVRQGEGSGVGAVAGGVVGGLLGNQMGKGSGRTAMTVLGAVGGGFAGNAIEKHQRAQTVYVVKVRMDDGTLRSFTRTEPWAAGQRVTVDGSSLQLATGDAAAASGTASQRERMLQTSSSDAGRL